MTRIATDPDVVAFIAASFERELARRVEAVRIAETAIALHQDRIAGHQAAIVTAEAEFRQISWDFVEWRRRLAFAVARHEVLNPRILPT